MSELVILPEMIEAGIEALIESRERDLSDSATSIAVYLAMEAIREIAFMRDETGRVH